MKKTFFIEEGDGILRVPRPSSVNAGLSRSMWIKRITGKNSVIVSPDAWEVIKSKFPVKVLIEDDEGNVSIQDL